MKKKLEKHIYLLEDDEDLSEALRMALEHEKYICHAFHSTLDFFEAIDTFLDNSWTEPGKDVCPVSNEATDFGI